MNFFQGCRKRGPNITIPFRNSYTLTLSPLTTKCQIPLLSINNYAVIPNIQYFNTILQHIDNCRETYPANDGLFVCNYFGNDDQRSNQSEYEDQIDEYKVFGKQIFLHIDIGRKTMRTIPLLCLEQTCVIRYIEDYHNLEFMTMGAKFYLEGQLRLTQVMYYQTIRAMLQKVHQWAMTIYNHNDLSLIPWAQRCLYLNFEKTIAELKESSKLAKKPLWDPETKSQDDRQNSDIILCQNCLEFCCRETENGYIASSLDKF
jgi:hypothetical protein